MEYESLNNLEYYNRRAGKCFFSKDTMRFFNSRVSSLIMKVGNKAIFITSERMDYRHPRLYTVRAMDYTTGEVDSLSEFQEYTSLSGAKARALRECQNLINQKESI